MNDNVPGMGNGQGSREALVEEVEHLRACMRMAGLQSFMKGRPAAEIADHWRDVSSGWALVEQKLAMAEADVELLRDTKLELEGHRRKYLERIEDLEAQIVELRNSHSRDISEEIRKSDRLDTELTETLALHRRSECAVDAQKYIVLAREKDIANLRTRSTKAERIAAELQDLATPRLRDIARMVKQIDLLQQECTDLREKPGEE